MPPANPETEARLLDAAGQVFAERGFAAATVREICERAEANIAAVNYHYRDKLGLYRAVFRHAASHCWRPDSDELPTGTPAERLRLWIRTFLGDLVAKDHAGWPGRLMAREMAEPTGVLSEWIELGIRPRLTLLNAILAEAAPGADPLRLRRSATSVVGQVIFYHHARPVLAQLAPDLALSEASADAIADHITAFSLAGIRDLGQEQEQAQP